MFVERSNFNYKRYGMFLFFVVILIVAYFLFNGGDKFKNNKQYTTEFILKEDGDTFEVRYDHKSKNTFLFKNGKRSEILSGIPRRPNKVLVLPKVKGKEDIVSDKPPISELTWESSLEESVKYLNFLKGEGYRVIREAKSHQFAEFILRYGENKKRIIIFNNVMMVGDLDKDAKLPKLDEYLKQYRN